jgi:hypothetical protein
MIWVLAALIVWHGLIAIISITADANPVGKFVFTAATTATIVVLLHQALTLVAAR